MEEIGYYDASELAVDILGINYDEENDNIVDVADNGLVEEYNIDVEIFTTIVNKIMERTLLDVSLLTNTPRLCLTKKDGEVVYKKEIYNEFIGGLITFLKDGEDLKINESKITTITSGDKQIYEVTIKKL